MNHPHPNRGSRIQKVVSFQRSVELSLKVKRRLSRLVSLGLFHADVRFGYRHVILHAQPAAGIAVH